MCMAASCLLRQQRLFHSRSSTANCSFLTRACRRIHSRVTHSALLQGEAIVWLRGQWSGRSASKLSANWTRLTGHPTQRLCHIGASHISTHLPGSLTWGTRIAALHTLGTVMAAQEVKGRGSKSGTHGSVLMEMIKSQDQQPKQVTVGTKVVQAGKDFTYLIVIIAGFVVAGFLLWSVGSEFFSQNSPSVVYSRALKRVKSDPRVVEVLGEPISGHGAPSGRGRRRDVLHQEYIVDNETYMRVKFYVDGSKRKGTVHVDLKKNQRGKYDCRFLYVELKGHPAGTIVLEDNR